MLPSSQSSSPVTLWISSEPHEVGSLRLKSLGEPFWSVRIRQENIWVWARMDGMVDVNILVEHLSVLPGVDLKIWQPSPLLNTVLVDSLAGKRKTLASWQPFPDPLLADMHEECFQVAAKTVANYGAADLLGSVRKVKPSGRDPAYWLSTVTPHLAKAALGLAKNRFVPIEAAGAALIEAGFYDLPKEAAEIVATLAGEWTKDVPSLVNVGTLII